MERCPSPDRKRMGTGPQCPQVLTGRSTIYSEWQCHRGYSIGSDGYAAVAFELPDGNPVQAQRELHLLGLERVVIGILQGERHHHR